MGFYDAYGNYAAVCKTWEKSTSLKSIQADYGLDTAVIKANTDEKIMDSIIGIRTVKIASLDAPTCIKEKIFNCRNITMLVVNDKITHCLGNQDFKVLGTCTSLQKLVLRGNKYVTDISPLGGLKNLELLELVSYHNVTTLRGLENIPHINTLRLICMENLRDISSVGCFRHLKTMELSCLPKLEDLNNLGNVSVHVLTLDCLECPNLEFLKQFSELRDLVISHFYHGFKFPDLSGLNHLKLLNLSDVEYARNTRRIYDITSLEILVLSNISEVKNLSNLPKLVNLTNLCLSEIEIKNITPVSQLPGLKSLIIGGIDSIRDISPISSMKQLEYLELRDLEQLADISCIRHLSGLKKYKIYDSLPLVIKSGVQLNDILPPHIQLTNVK